MEGTQRLTPLALALRPPLWVPPKLMQPESHPAANRARALLSTYRR